MAANYSGLSRFFFDSYSKIQDGINAGKINQWDIVLCADTREMFLVNENFDLIPIHSKVLRFQSVTEAETYLNQASDTYQGQMVSILHPKTGSYQAYIVNQNGSGQYKVSSISVFDASDIDYDNLGNRPIVNSGGDIEHPLVLYKQPTGIYRVNGAYQVSDEIETIYQSYNSDLFTVTHNEDGTTRVRCITGDTIVSYLVMSDGAIVDEQIAVTQEWLRLQGYVNDSTLQDKLDTLGLMTRTEAQTYINQLIRDQVAQLVRDQFDAEWDQRVSDTFIQEDQANIYKLFDIHYTPGGGVEVYHGAYSVTPSENGQVLDTEDKYLSQNVEIFGVPFYEVSNEYGTTVSIG